MSFLAWIVLGLVAGYIGSKIVNRQGEGILFDILLGVVGAFAGGFLFHIFGASGVGSTSIVSSWRLLARWLCFFSITSYDGEGPVTVLRMSLLSAPSPVFVQRRHQ
jgi:uncharacterized membrane protein YeaQ/YmgE (transglycosylase-associated protein family)